MSVGREPVILPEPLATDVPAAVLARLIGIHIAVAWQPW